MVTNLAYSTQFVSKSLDIRSAFDCIGRKLKIQKLNNIGFSGLLLKLYVSYLENLLQYVQYNNSFGASVSLTLHTRI